MINRISRQGIDLSQLEQSLKANQDSMVRQGPSTSTSGGSFADMLKEGLGQVNSSMQSADTAATDLATGKSSNIHETMLSATKAELGFNLMVQLRNKAIESYQEVMRMQV
jgi:flagellar hook-basal body complex protein FliE